jgi:flagellar biosynthetic protein FliP
VIIARALLLLALVLVSAIADAQTIPLVTSTPMPNGNTEYALGIQILMVMTVLTLLPAMLITMTAFTRILIVLAILRQALGTQQTPSNQIILGLSLFFDSFYHVTCH